MTSSTFYPQLRYISSITQAQYAVVTFTEDHQFTDGEIVSFRVSKPYGMIELNNQQTRVLSHTDDTITIGINTINFNAFVTPADEDIVIPAVAVPAGSGIIPDSYPATVNLEDAFDNIPAN